MLKRNNEIGEMKEDMAAIRERLAIVEKLQWITIAGVFAVVIKSFI